MKQYTVKFRKKVGEDSYWKVIGTAFQHPGEEKITLVLDSMPIPQFWDGQLYLFPRENT